MAQRYQAIGDYVKMLTVGTNPADSLAAVLSTHRDQDTLKGSSSRTPVPDVILPVDTPPWWHTKKKHGLFWNGMSRGDHRDHDLRDVAVHGLGRGGRGHLRTLIISTRSSESVEAPKYPFGIDTALAAEDEAVFSTNCSCCHGTYGDDAASETYPNLLLPLATIGTDPLLAFEAHARPFAEVVQ